MINIEAGCGLRVVRANMEKSKSIIYYTDNKLGEPINSIVQMNIYLSGLPIYSSSLEPIRFGQNVVIEGERGYPTMVKQIISCLERSNTTYVFFCEHDVLYHASHFDFTPEKDNIFYYNENVWRWMFNSDTAITHDRMIPLSCLCVNREFALNHYKLRDKVIREKGFDKIKSREPAWARKMGYEPGTKKRRRGGVTDDDFETWMSELPNIDIRHKGTFSSPKTKLENFIHKPKWWREININEIPGWDLRRVFS